MQCCGPQQIIGTHNLIHGWFHCCEKTVRSCCFAAGIHLYLFSNSPSEMLYLLDPPQLHLIFCIWSVEKVFIIKTKKKISTTRVVVIVTHTSTVKSLCRRQRENWPAEYTNLNQNISLLMTSRLWEEKKNVGEPVASDFFRCQPSTSWKTVN